MEKACSLCNNFAKFPVERIAARALGKRNIEPRRKQGIEIKSINAALSVVRRILKLAATLWRDENILTWLETPPPTQMLPVIDVQ